MGCQRNKQGNSDLLVSAPEKVASLLCVEGYHENDQLCEDSEGIAEGSRCKSYGGRKGLEVLKLLKYALESNEQGEWHNMKLEVGN